LTNIDLSENSISYINDMMFKNLPNLRVISLHSNQITSLSSNAFTDLYASSSVYIYLHNNDIKMMSKNIFLNTNKLYYLNLNSNSLKVIPDFTMFSGKTNLRSLLYADNKFIRGCRNLTNVACYTDMRNKIIGISGTLSVNFTLVT
jgi:hypothetical protein